ncbi:MAG: ABC transporter substrate-binding protein [Desulfobacteraceae bacterium]|nr:MAG: ABC transporter substrate-binding protein [Desulfobacteraceae bacterium]
MVLRRLVLAALLAVFLGQSPENADAQLKQAVFIPQWVPQAQFAGYYFALEKGIYRKHGIDLEILSGGPHNSSLDRLKDGKADFATLWLSTAIQARAEGLNVVNIAQILPRSALMLVAKKSSGILTPWDLNGKKVGLWPSVFQVQPKAFFKRYDLNVVIVPQSFSVNLFLRDGVDVASAMWYNEYHTILSAGYNPEELTTFFFHEHGLNFPEEGIYVLEERLKKDPELCRAFVSASLEGWIAAFADPEEALKMVMKNLKREYIPATRVHQRWMLERMKDLILTERKTIDTKLLSKDYYRVATSLHSSGLIETVPEYASFYKDLIADGTR